MEPLPEGLVAALATPAAYPADATTCAGVQHIQTHISHVFLSGDRVYKLRKAVKPVFLDFSTRAARNADALRELTLNRRLAPDVYLGVAPAVRTAAGWQVGAPAESLGDGEEHVLVMRRLAEGCDALSLLAAGRLTPAHLAVAAERIAAFHREHALGAPAPFAPEEWRRRIDHPMQDNLASLAACAGAARLDAATVEALGRTWSARLAGAAPALEARRAAGRAVDGHGDLHLAHLWFEAGPAHPLFVDCIEFDEGLRRIDAAADVAFLSMDLVYRGAARLAERWLSDYAAASGDFGLYEVVDLYAGYRAAVRAKVAALAAADPEIGAKQRRDATGSAARHLALAARCLVPRPPGVLVLVAGTVGVGKSTVASALAEASGAVLLASDRTRKALAGLRPAARAAAAEGAGLYAPAWTERTYAALLANAAPALRSGRAVVLDATWSEQSRRRTARELAASLEARCHLVHVDCDEARARERVAKRAEQGGDPSDAGPEQVAPSRARFEPLDDWPAGACTSLRTDTPLAAGSVAALARELGLGVQLPGS